MVDAHARRRQQQLALLDDTEASDDISAGVPVLLPLPLLLQIAMEFGTTSRLAQSTAAAVQFGVDPQDALDKISKLQERLSTLEQVRHTATC
jgi:hypothetical protein